MNRRLLSCSLIAFILLLPMRDSALPDGSLVASRQSTHFARLSASQLLLLLTQHTTPTTVLGNRSVHEYVVEGRVEDQTPQIALWFLSF